MPRLDRSCAVMFYVLSINQKSIFDNLIMSTDALSLLTGKDVFTKGKIIFRKPYYIKNRNGEPRRIGYKLAISTNHSIEFRGNKVPIYISAMGKSDSWLAYRKLQREGRQIGISGVRVATKYYENKNSRRKKGFWIILSHDPPPHLLLIG